MRATIGCLVLLLVCHINTHAQSNQLSPEKRRQDSLDALIRSVGSRTDTSAARTLADAAAGYISFDSHYALSIATRADNLFTDNRLASAANTPLRAHVLNMLADVSYADNKYPEATKHYERALAIARSIGAGANAEIAGALAGLAFIDRDQGAMDKAFAKSLEMMRYAERANDHRVSVSALSVLGIAYFAARDFVSADSLFAVALQQCRGAEDDDLRARLYNMKGILFDQMLQPERAIEAYRQGLVLERRLGRARNIGRLSSNIALVFMRLDKFDSALAYQKVSLRLYEQTKYDAGLANSLGIVAMTEVKLGRYTDAIASAKRAITYSEASRFLPEINYAYYVLTEAYSGLGDYKSALAMNKQMAALQDSIYNAASAEKLAELETAKKEQEIKLLQSKRAQESIIRNALIAGTLALVLIAVLLIRGNNRRKRDNARLAELNDKLFDANEELSLLTSEKDEILNIVSHGLKSQLFGVRSLADSITTAAAPVSNVANVTNVAEMSRSISRSATQMSSLVTNLLTVNAQEQGLLKPVLAQTNVTAVLGSVCEQFKEFAAMKSINFSIDSSIDAPQGSALAARADETMLREVLENLLSNAVKYSPHGKNIFVRLKSSSEAVRVEIQDEGPGISDDDQKKLFGKFVRLSAQPTGGEHSTGLGLSIVKKMVEAMNGRVWCESTLGNGATFVVELPAAQSTQSRLSAQ
jgi:signal transduction histidine kinase